MHSGGSLALGQAGPNADKDLEANLSPEEFKKLQLEVERLGEG